MLSTSKIGEVIKAARLKKNMTQLELADKLYVSFQAVSNWERGNSMPDISNIPTLCEVLEITLEDLFGQESKETNTIRKITNNDDNVTANEIAEVAPIFKPNYIAEVAKKSTNCGEFSLATFLQLAPFLSEEVVDEIVLQQPAITIGEIEHFAPFLSDEALEQLACKIVDDESLGKHALTHLAPYLSDEALDGVVKKAMSAANFNFTCIADLAPFLSDETLDAVVLAMRSIGQLDAEKLSTIAPFLSDSTMKKLVLEMMNTKNCGEFSLATFLQLAPFLSEEVVDEIVLQQPAITIGEIEHFAPFLSDEALEQLACKIVDDESLGKHALTHLAPYLSDEALDRVVKKGNERCKFQFHLYCRSCSVFVG